MLWSDGSLSLVEVRTESPRGERGQSPAQFSLQELAAVPGQPGALPSQALVRVSESGSITSVRLLPEGGLAVAREVVSENLLGEKETNSQSLTVDTAGLGPITAMTMDRDGTELYIGTATGQLGRWVFDDEGQTRTREIVTAFRDRRRITALAMVFGDVSVAVGDAQGELTTWFPVRDGGKPRLAQRSSPDATSGAVCGIVPAQRHKCLLSLGEDGSLHLDHMTSERHLASLADEPSAAPARGPGAAGRRGHRA